MRNLLLLVVLIVAASMAGWFSIDRNDGETTIKINRNEIRNDAKQAIDKGRDYLNRRDDPNYGGESSYGSRSGSARDSYAGQGHPNQDLRYDYGQNGAQAPGTGYRPPAYQPVGSEQGLRYQDYGPQRPPSSAGQPYQPQYPTQSASNPQQNQYSR